MRQQQMLIEAAFAEPKTGRAKAGTKAAEHVAG
jgi:hypothetical protein